MQKKNFIKKIATLMAFVILMSSMSAVAFAKESPYKSTHEKIDFSDITGEIVEAPLLTSAASSVAKEKEWYEYVYYSNTPVACYYLSDIIRVSFYDPYDYAGALIMEVDDSVTDWSSNNSMQVSYTTGNSLSNSNGTSTDTTSSVEIANGQDISETFTDASVVTTTVEGRVDTYNYSKSGKEHSTTEDGTWDVSTQVLGEFEVTAGIGVPGTGPSVATKGGINVTTTEKFGSVDSTSWKDKEFSDEDGQKFSDYSHGYTEDNTTTTQVSDAGYSKTVSTVAERMSRAIGTSLSADITISTDNSTTVSKTYDASYFNDRGAPLQWKIIKYTVKMPMKYRIEYLVDGEWIFWEHSYCVLNTIQGTCRAWLENNVAYYEHWGTGEPVTWSGFWGQFFTEESLIEAYKNKLYPEY